MKNYRTTNKNGVKQYRNSVCSHTHLLLFRSLDPLPLWVVQTHLWAETIPKDLVFFSLLFPKPKINNVWTFLVFLGICMWRKAIFILITFKLQICRKLCIYLTEKHQTNLSMMYDTSSIHTTQVNFHIRSHFVIWRQFTVVALPPQIHDTFILRAKTVYNSQQHSNKLSYRTDCCR